MLDTRIPDNHVPDDRVPDDSEQHTHTLDNHVLDTRMPDTHKGCPYISRPAFLHGMVSRTTHTGRRHVILSHTTHRATARVYIFPTQRSYMKCRDTPCGCPAAGIQWTGVRFACA